MLDRLFLSRLSSTGKVAYFVGQFIAAIAIAIVVFGVMGMGMDEGELPLILGVLGTIVVWGPTCMAIWPNEPDVDEVEEDWSELEDGEN